MLTIGQPVVYIATDDEVKSSDFNYQQFHPAVVTAVLSDTSANIKVFADGLQDHWKTSLNLGSNPGNFKLASTN